jgi:hypothetical protein
MLLIPSHRGWQLKSLSRIGTQFIQEEVFFDLFLLGITQFCVYGLFPKQ